MLDQIDQKDETVHGVSRSQAAQACFQRVFDQIEKSEWRKALSRAAKVYNIKVYSLGKLTLNRVREIYNTIADKFYSDEKSKQNWNENELRVYVWLLFAYANSLGMSPADFVKTSDNWSALAGCFLGKSVHLCEFQYNSLKKLGEKSSKWAEEEDNLLTSILNQRDNKSRWNEVAKQLFLRSDKRFFRTSKQCRERWNNYLDPMKSHDNWTLEEDTMLVKAVYEKGKKWALISKLLESRRTEHMVKNRFNSLLCKYQKSAHKKTSVDNVPEEDLISWLNTRNEKESARPTSSQQTLKQSKADSIKVENPVEHATTFPSQQPALKQPIIPIPEKKEYCQKVNNIATPSGVPFDKSSMMLFSPVVPTYTPLVFSPYNQLSILIYQNQQSADQSRLSPMDPANLRGFNFFSFDNLPR